jgi:hypothetical protein
MKLSFPPLSFGITNGLNDAGIETFEGDYPHFVSRECGQNTLDAASPVGNPIQIKISRLLLETNELPFFPDLLDTLERCEVFWKDHSKPREFFNKALRLARKKKIFVLKISDYGTTGVPGGDDDMTKPWFGLVRSRGVSIKSDEGSGGAFGIGKDAPLAASAFRTVIYSTRTLDNQVAVQGICRLATHKDEHGLTQGTGFIGGSDKKTGEFKALRDEAKIPPRFVRKEPGLDVWIIGFRDDIEDWSSPFVEAALYNFWPAIHFGKMKLVIGETNIDQKTLPHLMKDFKKKEAVAEALPYYESLVSKESRKLEVKLPTAGHCSLFVHIAKADLPRKICMTRKTGMVIYSYPPRSVRVPFAGLFQCDDPKGNLLLKSIEPPRHDKWEAKRAEPGSPEKKAFEEIKVWVRDSLKELIPDLDSQMINEDAIADLLPDEDISDASNDPTAESDLGGIPKKPEVLNDIKTLRPAVRTIGLGNGSGNGGGGGGGGDGKRSGGKKEKGDKKVPRSIQIDLRSYQANPDDATYNLVARTTDDYEGDLLIHAVTEEGGALACPLAEARDASKKLLTVDGNKISGIKISADKPFYFEVTLKQPARLALRAFTHEKFTA